MEIFGLILGYVLVALVTVGMIGFIIKMVVIGLHLDIPKEKLNSTTESSKSTSHFSIHMDDIHIHIHKNK